MTDYLDKVISYYRGNELPLIVFVLCLIYLLLKEKRIRNRFIFPLYLINITIMPFIFDIVHGWLLCIHITLGITFICLIRRIGIQHIDIIVTVVLCVLMIVFGKNVYEDKGFAKVKNAEKMPEGIKEICDIMLSLNKEPRCIADPEAAAYLRAYSAKIRQLWGGDVADNQEKLSDGARSVYESYMADDEMYDVFNYAVRKNYHFVIAAYDKKIDQNALNLLGFSELYSVENNYRLYYYGGVER